MCGYFENMLVDSIMKVKKFCLGLLIYDILKFGEIREIVFLEMFGFGINWLWWLGGCYVYVFVYFDGFIDYILCVVDLKMIMKLEIVVKWWLLGMNCVVGELGMLKGKCFVFYYMIMVGDCGYVVWCDGGFIIYDISDFVSFKLLLYINWLLFFVGGMYMLFLFLK